METILRILLLGFLCSLLLACGSDKTALNLYSSDISDAGLKNEYSLTDHHGVKRTAADFAGKVVVLTFGYTFCPDVCPTTLSDLSHAVKALGPLAEKVQIIFVTVDPERDTQLVLSQYVPAFSPSFLGLYGTPEQTVEVAKNFKAFYAKQQRPDGGAYSVDHSAGSYVIDPTGKIRLFIKYGEKPDHITQDLKQLL
ncbi:hypothetical protein A7981_02700 [Methylovorus sp. MM2]|nr:hypothetical protein A7981_02700 [Methylovorus sp. MM2]